MAKTPRDIGITPIGSVVHSMLTEVQYQAQNGAGWVLMDGRSVVGSVYESITGNSVVPDGRGQFIRSKNNGRADGQQNPSGEVALGVQATDKMQGHHHTIRSSAQNGTSAGTPVGFADNAIYGSYNGYVTTPITDGANGTPRTGPETAPKNITVNYFIKIN